MPSSESWQQSLNLMLDYDQYDKRELSCWSFFVYYTGVI